jgi:hypothetical protein
MLQEIKDRPSLKDFPKTKMLYTEHKKLPRSVFHNRFTWPRAYNPSSASEIPFILGNTFYPPTLLFLANSFLQRYGGTDLLVCKNPQIGDLEHRLFLLQLRVCCGTSQKF